MICSDLLFRSRLKIDHIGSHILLVCFRCNQLDWLWRDVDFYFGWLEISIHFLHTLYVLIRIIKVTT